MLSAPVVELMPALTMMLAAASRVRLVAAPEVFAIAELTVMSPLPCPSPSVPLVCSTTLVPALSTVSMSVLRTTLPPLLEVQVPVGDWVAVVELEETVRL